MSEMIKYVDVESKILTINGQLTILDSDIAILYGVETKEINQAVKNNPDKFPEGYILDISLEEWRNLKSKILTSSWGGKNKPPKAFTEKSLYMLATILKSPTATQTTIAIVETFCRLREFGRVIDQIPDIKDEIQKKSLMQKCGVLFGCILDDLDTISKDTTVELNLAVVKVKHSVRREKRND